MSQYYPLSKTEEGIYVSCLTPTDAYNLTNVLRLGKSLDVPRFTAAVAAVFDAHPYLFTVLFEGEDGGIYKKLQPVHIELPVVEVDELDVQSPPFEMLGRHLFRLALYRVAGEYVFVFDFHHIIFDGTSAKLFIDQVGAVYRGESIEKETYSANEFGLDEQKRLQTDDYRKAKDFFEKAVKDPETDSALIEDKSEGTILHGTFHQDLTVLNADVKDLTKRLKIKTSAFFLATFGYLLSKINMDDKALFLTVNNGRDEMTRHSLGMFVKTFPFYLENKETVAEYLSAANDYLVGATASLLYPFSDAAKDLGVPDGVMFAYQGDSFYKTEWEGRDAFVSLLDRKDGKDKLSVEVYRENGRFLVWVEYRADLYEEDTVRHFIRLYDVALKEFLRKAALADVDLVDEKEKALLDSFNRADLSYIDANRTVLDDFRDMVKKYPDHPAVVFRDKRYTYCDVDRLSDNIAAYLAAKGVGKEDVVSVLINKSEYIVIASLGVLKSGAAYQPLDPSYPVERLAFMVKDVAAKALIKDRDLDLLQDYDGPILYTDEVDALPDHAAPRVDVRPRDLFIMLYTSGSTGVPKGVMLEHGNLNTFATYHARRFCVDHTARVAAYASYGFDADMLDLYPTLTHGGCVYVIPNELRLDLIKLGDYFNQNGVTHAMLTTQVGRQFIEMIDAPTLRFLLVGGEKLVPVAPPKYTLANGYGPTEGTVYCSAQVVDRTYYRVPIGKANETYKTYVLDKNGRRLPTLAQGELCIAGPQVARGYLNREEENKKAFLLNPFDEDAAFARLYRTGDVVRYLADGTLDFIGRKDGQVKIRGFRVELSEVEKVIREYAGVKDATVKDFVDPAGVKYLCAYVVSNDEIDVDDLNAFIASKKPPYMVPAYTMQIDAIPLNQNQKVNKRALPQPQLKQREKVAPEGEDEQAVYDILAGILGTRDFGVTTDVYEAGLTSVSSIRFAILLSKRFGKEVGNADFRACPTVRALTARLAAKEEGKTYEIRAEYPLSKLQEGIFVECTTHPDTTVYNIPVLIKLHPSVDVERLVEAVERVVDAHPYLKMRLHVRDDGDVVATRDDARKIAVGRITVAEGETSGLVNPFDLQKDDLFRAAIVTDGKQNYLFVDAHHIVFDGESLVVFMREVEEAYQGQSVPAETYTGFEVALDEEERVKSDDYRRAKAYYEDLLGAVDTECMPIRDRDEGVDRGEDFSVTAVIDKAPLAAFLKDSGTTVNALWNAAFGYALAKFLAREDCVYTTVYNGRSDSRLADAIGMYVHTLPVVFRMTAGQSAKDAVRNVAKLLADDMANDVYPFAEISRNFGVKANVMFVYEGNIGTGLTVGGQPAESVMLKLDALKADLSVFVYETGNGFRLDCEYNARYYEEWSIRSLLQSTVAALNAMISGVKIDEISLLSPQEKARLDATFVAHETEDTDVVTLFRRAAAAYPERNAVIFRDKRLTYRQLDEISDRVAAYVQSRGVGKEDRVSILVPRGEYMVIAALGVLKAGAAYEPLDPSYPPERLNFMVQNAKAKLVIADSALIGLLSEYEGDRLFIEDVPSLPQAKPVDPSLKGNNMFIILYTSGTTGTPKGVMLEHHNLVNFCTWYRAHYDLTPESVVGAYASFGFDADMMDLYPALTTGAAVYVIPEDMRLDLNALNEAFKENGVSHVFMTTQMGRMFAENIAGESLAHLSVGGETLAPVNPPKGFALWNGYGPTECTIFSTIWKIDCLYYRNPIGAALWNYKLYVVGKAGDELPVGALGELWIAGAGVGRGYLDLPEQTKKVFIANPFDSTSGFERAYRTGDVVRRLADGSIDFVGRNDGQVKIRGFRIELAEVEGVIREYPGVKNVTVQAFEDKAFGGKFLAAYVVADDKLDFGAIGEFIKSKKPPYMVPAAFMQLDEIPLNQNQKVNKRALPAPVRNAADTSVKDEPTTALEREICKVFANILGLEKVGATDDFFDIGGTSISAAKVSMYAAGKNYPVAYKDIFDNPTARALAKHITEASGQTAETQAVQEEEKSEEALRHNAVTYVNEIASVRPLGRTLLAGGTGFLGSHILKALLDDGVDTVVLSRSSKTLDAKTRLSAMMMYYFDETADDLVDNRLTVIDGDITNADLLDKLKDEQIDTIINAAACVKHFAADDIIERINVGGVENLIKVALAHDARLIQISTLSVAGENVGNKFPPTYRMKETQLYFGQDISNKYVNSKFKAEQAIVEAIEREGLDAKMIRVGNLMSRLSDGEFQVNAITNGFMRNLKGYATLKKFPVNSMDAVIDFTPIDEVAKAVLLLSTTGKEFTTFHAANSHQVQMGDVIYAMNEMGFGIDVVPDEEFVRALKEMMADEKKNMLVSALINYASSDGKAHAFIQSDNEFSNKALYHLGYKWPITDERYLENAIRALAELNFFIRTDI